MTARSTKLLGHWLSGTTCNRWTRNGSRKSIIWENDDYILLKHAGHSEYVDRMSPIAWCETYVALYAKKDIPRIDFSTGRGYIKQWTGRWSKQKFNEAMELTQ